MNDFDVRKLKKVIYILEKLEDEGSMPAELAYKYALLECCGWIEEKMHNILYIFIERQTSNQITQDFVKSRIKSINYSFKYADFKSKLSSTLGEVHVVNIEKHLESYDDRIFNFEHFKQYLRELKEQRDRCAHTYSRIGTVTAMGFTELEKRINYINVGLNKIKNSVKSRVR